MQAAGGPLPASPARTTCGCEEAVGLIKSLLKSWKLSRISKRLGKIRSSNEILASAMRQTVEGGQSEKEKDATRLLDLVESDSDLCLILQRYGATRKVLERLYSELCVVGAGQWAGGHFVAASSLAFGPTLDYLLRSAQAGVDFRGVAYRLIVYFKSGETGIIEYSERISKEIQQ